MRKAHYLLLFLLAIVFATLILWVTRITKGQVPYVDQWTIGLIDPPENSAMYIFFRRMTEFGSEPFLVPFTIVVGILIWWIFRDWLPAIIFSGGTLVSHLVNLLIKDLVERERPTIIAAANAEGFSFPSGHSMIPMVCYGLLTYLLAKKLKSSKSILALQLFFSLLIFLIGISRYMINVHYLTDIVAGFIIGFLFLVGFIYLYEFLQKLRASHKAPS